MSVFISIPVPQKFWPYLKRLQTNFPELRPANDFHMTLQFLGNEVDSEYIPEILREIRSIKHEKFTIEMLRPVTFGPPRDLRGVWVECSDNQSLIYLINKIQDALEICGFHEEKPFRPHITLGRYKKNPNKLPSEIKWEKQHFQARSFELIKSKQVDGGSQYEVLQKKFFM